MNLNRKGFSLIEVLITLVIVSTIMASLALAFQVGLRAQAESEFRLGEGRERDIFVMQLVRELRSAIPLSLEPFEGTETGMRFPTRLVKYSKKGIKDEIATVEYREAQGRLIRIETPLRRTSLKTRNRPVQETLFEGLKEFRIEYLYLGKGGTMQWKDVWEMTDKAEIPRAIRLIISGGIFGSERVQQELLIPQGILRVLP